MHSNDNQPDAAAHGLQGLGVLVTRPQHQAEPFCRLIEQAGGDAIRFPVLEVTDPGDSTALNKRLDQLAEYQIAIFISANAVRYAMSRIQARAGLPAGLRIAAIGRASARELQHMGVEVNDCPSRQFDSEALLALPGFADVAGQRILIFRGEGGREHLASVLRERGATVDYAEVYRRIRPAADTTNLMQRWARGEIQVITLTSVEALRNLYELVGKLGRQWLLHTDLIVASERIQQQAQSLGLSASITVACNASDAAMLECLVQWRQSHPFRE
ncbi:MAG TPA: uroporphyrinogen-III synthase [Gammaproteobacteria bacterium]|nr:uroporphyrinogen-III synthase [Gammaproteobacteria bacterium]